MTTKFGFSLGLIATLALAACSGSSKQDAANDTNATALQNQGTFTSPCQNVPGDLFNLNANKVQYKITGHIEKITTYYSDNACTDAVLVVDVQGEYSHVGPSQIPNTTGIADIDITWKHTDITPSASAGSLITLMNAIPGGYCGINNWAVNADRNVDAASGTPVTCIGTDALTTVYDIISTQNGALQFGQSSVTANKTSDAERPTVLDPTVVAHD